MFKKGKNFNFIIWIVSITALSLIYLLLLNVTFNAKPTFPSSIDRDFFGNIKMRTLDGEWEFYPNELIDPNDDFELHKYKRQIVNVPGTVDADFGTYRKVVLEPKDIFGFKFESVRNAFMLYINGVQTVGMGEVSIYLEHHVADSRSKFAFGTADDNGLELVMHISGFSNEVGIMAPIIYSDANTMMAYQDREMLLESMFVHSLFVLSIYFIALYFRQREMRFLKSLSLMTIASSILIGNYGTQVLRTYFNYGFAMRMNIQALCLLVLGLSFMSYLYQLLGITKSDRFKYKLIKFTKIVSMINIALMFIPGKFNDSTLLLIIVIFSLVLAILTSIIVVISELLRKSTVSVEVGFVAFSIVQFMIYFLIKIEFDLNTGHLLHMMIVLMIFSNTYIIYKVYRFDRSSLEQLKEVLTVSERKIDAFIRALPDNVLRPLNDILHEMDYFNVHDLKNVSEKSVDQFRKIQNQTQELAYLLQRVQTTQNDIHEEEQENSEQHNLQEYVNDSVRLFSVSNDMKDIIIRNEVEDNIYVNFEAEQLSMVIYKLLSNAVNSIDDWGVIKITSVVNEDFIVLNIQDNGCGIELKHLPYLFEEFYKISRRSKATGFGIGLFMVKKIIESHDGFVWINSAIDVGTTVSLALPYAKQVDILQNVSTSDIEQVSQSLVYDVRVMLCSKNKKLIEKFKRQYGHLVIFDYESNKVDEMIMKISKHNIDVLILDYNNDAIIKDEVLSKVRENYGIFELPVLLILNRMVFMAVGFKYQKGANDTLTYPFDDNILGIKIQNLMESKVSVEKGIEQEFKYLYNQIYPHFLYNTLNIIIGLSYTDNEKARTALLNLSVYLRAKLDVFKRNTLVSIEDELSLIDSYIEIESLRFDNNFEYNVFIEDELDFKIPPLLLQNLVENAFRHAFDLNKNDNKLSLKVFKKETKIHILMEDNGRGMDSETLAQINNHDTLGLGYNNTFKRISIIKGSTFNLSSEINMGTQIKITIPEVD